MIQGKQLVTYNIGNCVYKSFENGSVPKVTLNLYNMFQCKVSFHNFYVVFITCLLSLTAAATEPPADN